MEDSDSSKRGSWLNSAGDFTRGVGEGAWDGASGMVQGVGNLAKGAYHLATSADARSRAADTISKGATAAGQFAKTAMTDPAKAAGQVGLAAGDAVNNVSTAYHHAAANGHGAEFIGKIVGQGAVVAATLPVGGAEAEGAAAVGDVGRIAEAAGDLGKTGDAAAHASKALNVTDAASSNVVAHASNAATTEQVATGSDSAVTQLAAASKAAKPTSTGATFADEKKLASHFQAHGKDFGSSSAADYESKANKFLTSTKSADTLEKLRVNGDKVRFNPNTDEFGVISKSGVIRTYYKPEPTTHGYATNMAYFNAQ